MQFPVAHSQGIPVHFPSQSNHLCLGLLQVGLHWYYQNNSLGKKTKSSGSGCSGLAAATLELEQILTTFFIILK